MGEILQQFYDEIGEWILKGAPLDDSSSFGNTGLCTNLRGFIFLRYDLEFSQRDVILKEMESQFRAAGLNPEYPFDDENGESYTFAMREGKLYDNQKRYMWVFDHMSSAARLRLIKGI